MKKLIAIFALACSVGLTAQTLQFSQVKLVTTQETVPAGKVWKVEGFFPTTYTRFTSSSSITEAYVYNFVINGANRPVGATSFMTTYFALNLQATTIQFPLWLPAGTSLAAGSYVGEISVIEFNIVP